MFDKMDDMNCNVFSMYSHSGSANHGCEAIVRSTQKLLNQKMILFSDNPEEDYRYGLENIIDINKFPKISASFFEKARIKIHGLFLKDENYGYKVKAKQESNSFAKDSIALSIGGDTYCYQDTYKYYLSWINKYLHKKKIKTVLWGCSIEPKEVTRQMKRDFERYDLIIARESISYNKLKSINTNTYLACDPAFLLNKVELPLPECFIEGKTVGINISPLIQNRERIPGITLTNYRNLIRYIISTTEYNVALIPHVVSDGNDDRVPLCCLFEEYKNSNRICLIPDCNCEEIKGYISRCAFFIGARTHSTIAAYSCCVPTLTIGYSTKSIGIATDLFGTSDNYVIPVQSLINPDTIVNAFMWLTNNANDIVRILVGKLPSYKASIGKTIPFLECL